MGFQDAGPKKGKKSKEVGKQAEKVSAELRGGRKGGCRMRGVDPYVGEEDVKASGYRGQSEVIGNISEQSYERGPRAGAQAGHRRGRWTMCSHGRLQAERILKGE
jgi:hypothetical protein